MPANRKPTRYLELVGAYKRNPSRRRVENDFHTPPIGRWRGPRGAVGNVFRELVRKAPAGLLTRADYGVVEVLAHLIAQARADPTHLARSKARLINTALRKCGMAQYARFFWRMPDEFRPADAALLSMLASRDEMRTMQVWITGMRRDRRVWGYVRRELDQRRVLRELLRDWARIPRR